MEVDDTGLLLDLGTQLNGKVRGPLKTYAVTQGDIVSLAMTVLDGAEEYAAVLKRLETGGQLNSQDNHLVWSEANDPGNVWTQQGAVDPYFTKDDGNNGGILWGDQPVGYTFDLLVDVSTPVDVYDLEFAVAARYGGPPRYGDEHFYLQVVPIPEPSTFAMIAGLGALGLFVFGRRRRRA